METVELDVEGMTCAACATRIEKNLNRLEGVEASVNLATERATDPPPASGRIHSIPTYPRVALRSNRGHRLITPPEFTKESVRCSPFVRPMEAVFRLMFLPSSLPPF